MDLRRRSSSSSTLNSIGSYLVYGLILSLASYPIPSLRFGNEESSVVVGIFLLPVLYFVFVLKILTRDKFLPSKILINSILLWVVGLLISTLVAKNVELVTILKIILYLSIPILFSSILNNYNLIAKAVYWLIFICTILALYGYYGYLTGNVGIETSAFWWESSKYWGIHYLNSTRNSDVYYVALPLCFLIPFVFYSNKVNKLKKLLLLFLTVLFASALLLSFSRGAWISISGAIIAMIIIQSKGFRLKRIFLIFISIIFILFISYYILSIFNMTDYFKGKILSIFSYNSSRNYLQESTSNEIRWILIKYTINIIYNNFFLGIGIENLKYVYNLISLPFNHPENYYLGVLAENGILAFIGFLNLICYPIIITYKAIKSKLSNELIIGTFLASIYFFFSYFFNVEIYNLFNWVVHSIIWSYTILLSNQLKKKISLNSNN